MWAKQGSEMDDGTDSRSTAAVLSVLPCLVLVGYVVLIGRSYSPYLDLHLRYRSAYIPVAPEDAWSLGFGLPWAAVALVFGFFLASALAVRTRRLAFATELLALFCILSFADLYLYRVLESRVIGVSTRLNLLHRRKAGSAASASRGRKRGCRSAASKARMRRAFSLWHSSTKRRNVKPSRN